MDIVCILGHLEAYAMGDTYIGGGVRDVGVWVWGMRVEGGLGVGLFVVVGVGGCAFWYLGGGVWGGLGGGGVDWRDGVWGSGLRRGVFGLDGEG